jgi:hypothetical protein
MAAAEERSLPPRVVLPGQTPEGEFILAVLFKRTYDLVAGGRCGRAAQDQKLVPGEVHYGDPMNTSVKLESDFVPYKLATDVVLNGKAYAPNGRATLVLNASLSIGKFRKEIAVIGDRVCRYREDGEPAFTDPAPFTTMELRYERAYGGIDIYSDPKVPCAYVRNPLGRGFAVSNIKRAIEGLPLPNLEDPANLLTPGRLTIPHFMYWERQPMPQGFGWYAKHWQPRASYAGVMPADRAVERELRKAYAALVPAADREMYDKTELPDMDFRFFSGASPGLALPFLSGDEKVEAANLSPEGQLSFQLPGERPRLGLDIGSGVQEPPTMLHTVLIRMEERQVDLVWRAAVPYAGPDWLPEMKKMEVLIQ